MGKTLIGSLANVARRSVDTPIPYASRGAERALPFMRPRGMESQMRAMGSVGTLFSIVNRTSNATAQVDWKLWRKSKSGRREDRIEVTSHAALDLWNKPNKFMPRQEFVETFQQHVDLVGEGWWVIAYHPMSTIPLEIWPVRPDRMTPVPSQKAFLAGYVYTSPDGEQIPLELHEVVQLRMPNPLDPYRGMGPVQSILTDLDATRYSAEWNRNFFLNSAEPGGIIEVPSALSDPDFDQLRSRWNEQHRGVANAHRVAILEHGKWIDRKLSQRDMQFAELRSVSREVIREAFGIPAFALGEVADVNRATAESSKTWFAEQLTIPRLERIKAALNHDLLPLFGTTAQGLEFDYESPVPADPESEATQLTARANAAKALIEAGLTHASVLSATGLPDMESSVAEGGGAISARELTDMIQSIYLGVGTVITWEEGRDILNRAGAGLNLTTPAPAAARPNPAAAPTAFADLAAHILGQSKLTNADDDDALEQVRVQYDTALEALLTAWEPIAQAQINELTDAIEAAVDDEDLPALAGLTVSTDDAEVALSQALAAMATTAAEQMADEAAQQGVTVPVPTVAEPLSNRARLTAYGDELVTIAAATASIIGDDMARQAAVEALRQYTPGAVGSRVAASVKTFLGGLKNRFRRDQLGGAMHRAQNLGRIAVIEETPARVYTATEKLDGNTCLAPEVLVTTRSGAVPAKDVTLDDELLTHSGQWLQPSRIVVSDVEEELTRIHLGDGRSLRLTWDHPVLVRTGDGFAWRNAGELTAGDLVVDQSSLQLGGELACIDLDLGQSPDDVSPAGYVLGLPLVDVGAQRVPVGSVGFDDQTVANEEVHDPGADLSLGTVGVAEPFELLTDSSLDAGLGIAGSVAALGAIPRPGSDGRDDTESSSAVAAVDDYGRPSAGLGAVAALGQVGVSERCAAALADVVDAPGIEAALSGAVGVAAGVGERDCELDLAVRTHLADAPQGGSDLGNQFRVGVLALLGAVHSAGPLPAGDLSGAHLAQRRSPARVSAQPRRADGTALAQGALLDPDAACRTRLIHDFSLQVTTVLVGRVERERYAGEVYDFTVPGDETFWAEGVLVHNCTPCREIDGTEYEDATTIRALYAAGGYQQCEGGARCRGTFTARWEQR